ncbi:hypothetical protein F5876DRAFT_79321 [Lentinula aff. lateritia]|uniref:Uncharacterized protein n=1 Tax=Lentinula aff. lateritia TaxID=2804960 RepID=A0ACC1TTE2_9AGAR|nr:hypothetical protein F5876DRAFT_79321 [Lentinula aff. lateritia]
MSRYNRLQTHVQQYALTQTGLRVELHNNDIIAGEILTLTFCSFISTLFGLEFIMLVLWPQRTSYPRSYNYTRMILAVVMAIGLLLAAIVTTIVVFTRSAFITGASAELQEQYISVFSRPPLKYNTYSANVACVCFLWISWLYPYVEHHSTILLIIGVRREMKASTGTREATPVSTIMQENEKPSNEFEFSEGSTPAP